ncbi:MAG: Mth938-like domain-containing protein [Betaproteobacteria bacterium]|nr:Mth938-like domain-containing protein [Betaproteobacteria bacterium]MDH3438971.1 Mth938-like domain-containing protein [Betaproteobacteria bacterium]
MKLHLSTGEGQHLFSGHGPGYVAVNRVRYEASIVVTPASVTEWTVTGFDALSAADFAPVLALKPEVVIFGTGRIMRFPARELALALAAAGIGLEVMDSGAACRTYNILAGEGRKVAAAILVD